MPSNRSQPTRRARIALTLAALAFVVGAIAGASGGGASAGSLAERFVADWTRADYAGMYAALPAASRRARTVQRFAQELRGALRTATATSERLAGSPRALPGGDFAVPVRVHTRLFGTLALEYRVRVLEGAGEGYRVQFSHALEFPGLRAGEQLSTRTFLPRRAALLARDGSVLAETPSTAVGSEAQQRVSPLGELGAAVLGGVGAVPAERLAELEAQGVPARGPVGLSGVELALDSRLRGKPGGELLAGARMLAYAAPHAAPAVRSTVSPTLQSAAVRALGGQYGAIVAMAPSSGEILAVAGIGLQGLQPPGSTFKIVTLSGVLSTGVADPHTVFPYSTYATLDGVKLDNAHREECGGSLALAFAVSCNSVFAPLGVKLGAARLVSTAEAYGFNHPAGVGGAAESTLPGASAIQGELALGATAIGQGEVLATPLQMATVAATIADGGTRPQPTFLLGSKAAAGTRAASAAVAHTVRRLMIGVVREGTGTAAAIPGVSVAGKTGTAEVKAPCTPPEAATQGSQAPTAETPALEACKREESEGKNTDAWFAAFAPSLHPRIAVCVLLVQDGAGGTTAAPVARQVIEAALQTGI